MWKCTGLSPPGREFCAPSGFDDIQSLSHCPQRDRKSYCVTAMVTKCSSFKQLTEIPNIANLILPALLAAVKNSASHKSFKGPFLEADNVGQDPEHHEQYQISLRPHRDYSQHTLGMILKCDALSSNGNKSAKWWFPSSVKTLRAVPSPPLAC